MSAASFTLSVNGLGKRYNREWIFRNLTQTFQSGKTYAVTGANGSGKSTLLQVLWGQLPQSEGKVSYSASGKDIPVEQIFEHIAIAAPFLDLIEELTLQEQLEFHFNMRKPRQGFSIDSMIDKLYMTDSRDKQIVNFSSGMKQRVKLGLAFFTEASIIFLDEPGTNLDETAFSWYLDNLKAVPSDALIFIASNQKNEYPDAAHILSIGHYT